MVCVLCKPLNDAGSAIRSRMRFPACEKKLTPLATCEPAAAAIGEPPRVSDKVKGDSATAAVIEDQFGENGEQGQWGAGELIGDEPAGGDVIGGSAGGAASSGSRGSGGWRLK